MHIPEDIEIDTLFEDGDHKVTVDPQLMSRVMNNLVINAVQAMPKGGKLTIKFQKNMNEALISVLDTGVGIPEKDKPQLFTPLFTTKSRGQGLGLTVCKRIVELITVR